MNKIEFGDCREIMRRWAQESVQVQTCVTSPPYYGLRDYGQEGQLGLEETPEEYIANMVEVFQCVKDILADDGTLWLNIGDSYCNSNGFARASPEYQRKGRKDMPANDRSLEKLHDAGYKTKDLIGIPWMLAFALRADGWYLRQDIIWSKPNPMPESVQDRCTKSHEYIFLLSKSSKYYYDYDSIKEPVKQDWGTRDRTKGKYHNEGTGLQPHSGLEKTYEFANKRSVWNIPVKPYDEAHFAVYPTELIEPCIMAGAPIGGIVLDPFMGSGTTAQVAQALNRQYLGCELNEKYKSLQQKRLRQLSLELA